MKKYLAVGLAALTAAAIAVLCALSLVLEEIPRFSDVKRSDPNRTYIIDLVNEGIMIGREDGTFGVDEPVSRREVMELLLKVTGVTVEVLEEDAVEHKLVYTFEEAGADEPATRLETAQMAARALDLLPLGGESPYSDCDDGYAVKLQEKGIWDSGTQFLPEEPMTRGELAALLWHMSRVDVSVEAFRYNGYWIDMLDDVPRNEYDPAEFGWGRIGFDYTGPGYDIMQGVDVSRYQGDIDWEKVKKFGMEFAIIRVGGRFINSGGLYDDRLYKENIEGALAAGLEVGVYFFSQAISAEEGLEEAEYVLSCIEGYDLTMPVVIDWEYLGGDEARTYGVEPEAITDAVRAFCDRIREAGYEPMVYFNSYSGYIRMDLRELTDVKFWFAQYNDVPTFRYHFDMWQYSDQGRVDGIEGNVDLNLYFKPQE